MLQIKIAHFPFSHGLTGTNRCPEGRWLANMFQKRSREKRSRSLITERALVVAKERHPFNLVSFYFTFVLECIEMTEKSIHHHLYSISCCESISAQYFCQYILLQ